MRSESRDQALGLLANFSPQDPVEIGVLDIGVAGKRLGEGCLAIATRAAQRGGDAGNGIPFRIEQSRFKRVELPRAGDEIRRQLGRHHRYASQPGVPLKFANERHPLLRQIEIVDMAKPAR
jgi:hypothetical protein